MSLETVPVVNKPWRTRDLRLLVISQDLKYLRLQHPAQIAQGVGRFELFGQAGDISIGTGRAFGQFERNESGPGREFGLVGDTLAPLRVFGSNWDGSGSNTISKPTATYNSYHGGQHVSAGSYPPSPIPVDDDPFWDAILDTAARSADLPALDGGGASLGYTDVVDDWYLRMRVAYEDIIVLPPDGNYTSIEQFHTNYTFFTECLIHELGHAYLAILERILGTSEMKARVCDIFDRSVGEWDTGNWADQVKEASCEVFKDIVAGRRGALQNDLGDEAGRKFDNRTNIQMTTSTQFDKWFQLYERDVHLADGRDDYPLLWTSGPPTYGNTNFQDFGSTPDVDGNYAVDAPGVNPDGGTWENRISGFHHVFYQGPIMRSVVYLPTDYTYDALPRYVYDGAVNPTDIAAFAAAAPAAELDRWRLQVYKPTPGQEFTIRVDWTKPATANPTLTGFRTTNSYTAPGGWDQWRLAGRMMRHNWAFQNPDFPGDTTPWLDQAVTGACLAVWQQTFDKPPRFEIAGDEYPSPNGVSIPSGVPIDPTNVHWYTVSDESFPLPTYADSPAWATTLTVPEWDADATGVRLLLQMGTHYWNGSAAVPAWDPQLNPLGSTWALVGFQYQPQSPPVEEFVKQGLMLPDWWQWTDQITSATIYGGYWELPAGYTQSASPLLTHGIVPTFGAAVFPRSPTFGRWWPVWKPNRSSNVIGTSGNFLTTGFPYPDDGLDYEITLVNDDVAGPTPQQVRRSAWPYGWPFDD